MEKIIGLVKNLNDISESREIFGAGPRFDYGFSLNTDGRYSVLSLGPLELVDGQEFPMATAPELIEACLEGLEKYFDALRHAEMVLRFIQQNIMAARLAQAAKREMDQ